MPDDPEVFDTAAEAEARCRELERDSDSSWIAYPAQGRWLIAETNLPRQASPDGTGTETDTRPLEPDNPRPGPGQNLPGTGYL